MLNLESPLRFSRITQKVKLSKNENYPEGGCRRSVNLYLALIAFFFFMIMIGTRAGEASMKNFATIWSRSAKWDLAP